MYVCVFVCVLTIENYAEEVITIYDIWPWEKNFLSLL